MNAANVGWNGSTFVCTSRSGAPCPRPAARTRFSARPAPSDPTSRDGEINGMETGGRGEAQDSVNSIPSC